MESFDFSAVFRNHERKHKMKPAQFASVAEGVRKRRENTIKRRRSSRFTFVDSSRILPVVESPKKKPEPLSKLEHRRMQLEKWKEEKEKKKQLAAAQKRKPFVAGVAHHTLKFEPPLPPTKVMPSTSGRVTRSQTSKNNPTKVQPEKPAIKQTKTKSFAPRNAAFNAPVIKNMSQAPVLAPPSKGKQNMEMVTFKPIQNSTRNIKINVTGTTQPTCSKKKLNGTTQPTSTKTKVTGVIQPNSIITNLNGATQSTSTKINVTGATQLNATKSSVTKKAFNQVEKRSTRRTDKKVESSDQSEQSSVEMLSVPKQHKRKTSTPKKIIQTFEEVVELEQPQTNRNNPRKSIDPNKTTTPKNPIPKSESGSEEKLRSPKSPLNVTPEQIVEEATKNSPFVTHARGKANARRETMRKIDEGLLDDDAYDVDSVGHFRRQLDSEIKRMTEMCDTWEKISEQNVLPENVQELVLGAVGQARLLMSHKLQQFASLVQRCERPEPGRALVTPADLHGFWDMVFMQVENVNMRFKKLEELRARDWCEEVAAAPLRGAAPRAKRPARAAPRPAASRLRDVIAAARRAKKQEETQPPVAGQESSTVEDPTEQARTFEAGFFCVRSPAKIGGTPPRAARPSLLQSVLSSEAKKSASKKSTSLAMMRASLIGKEVENDSPIVETPSMVTPINLNATPSRSILKPVNTASIKKSSKKSIKVVLFDHSDTETHNTPHKEEYSTQDTEVTPLEDFNTDKGIMDIEKDREQKENKAQVQNKQPKRKSLIRQNATEGNSPVMTRSRRKSMPTLALAEDTVEKTPKRTSRRKKALQEVQVDVVEEKTQRKSSSRRRSAGLQSDVA